MSTDFSTPVDPNVPARIWPPSETSSESGKKRARAAKRPAPHAAPEFDAPFAAISVQPVDAPAWPIHPVCWFQPEPAAVLPSWNGLDVERTHRIPTPGFVLPETNPQSGSAALAHPGPRILEARVVVPQSGLAPLAPQLAFRKEGQ